MKEILRRLADRARRSVLIGVLVFYDASWELTQVFDIRFVAPNLFTWKTIMKLFRDPPGIHLHVFHCLSKQPVGCYCAFHIYGEIVHLIMQKNEKRLTNHLRVDFTFLCLSNMKIAADEIYVYNQSTTRSCIWTLHFYLDRQFFNPVSKQELMIKAINALHSLDLHLTDL